LLSCICLLIILFGLYKVLQRTGWAKAKRQNILIAVTVIILVWLGILCVLAYNSFFSDFSKLPPRPALAILIPLPLVLIFVFSKAGTKLIRAVPPQWLVFMQSFRIFVELMLWSAFAANKLPVQMTFEGGNFDVLSGILAIPVGWLLLTKRSWAPKAAIAYNILGVLLLLNILVIAVLSMPTPFRYFMNEPSNTLVAEFPIILLPGFLVPLAYSFHIFSLRQLLKK
ncbi:MAG: hypothetical protein ABIN74_15135, partial [Ferruginibacter sp.]